MKEYPRIPREEYEKRWQKVRSIMREKDVQALLVYADDHFTYGNAYARYYADFPVAFEPVLILFRENGDPVLLCGPESDGFAGLTGTIKDIRVLQEFANESEDYPFSDPWPLREIMEKESEKNIRRLGLAGMELMTAGIYKAISEAFPEAELVEMDMVLGESRGVKTESELEVIRYAYKIAEAGMKAAIDAVASGVTEREIAAKAEYAMRMMGSEGTGIDTIIASGENTRPILAKTRMREIQENDIVIVTLAPRYEGYHAAIGRTILVGNPDEKIVEAVKAEARAQEACASELKAGAVGSEVEKIGRKVMEEAGYGKNFLYSGLHSVGVVEFEPPIFGPSSESVLQDNMVISIDIPLFEADGFGARTEDGFIICGDKAERLTNLERVIRK